MKPLNSTQLNNLILSYLVRFAAENDYPIEEGFVDTGKFNIRTHFKQLAKHQELAIFVFQAVSDDKRPNEENNLAYINDIIKVFFKKKYPINAKLLIPLNQSRLEKRHSVLVEINFLEKTEIIEHNSQSKWKNLNFLYPNCLNDLKGSMPIESVRRCYYQKQQDNVSCGFFVYSYIQSVLSNGNSSQLKNIYVTLLTLIDHPTLLEDTLNENFVKKYSNARKITASGAALSWQKSSFDKEIDKTSYQELHALNLDFPEDFQENTEETNDQKMIYSR